MESFLLSSISIILHKLHLQYTHKLLLYTTEVKVVYTIMFKSESRLRHYSKLSYKACQVQRILIDEIVKGKTITTDNRVRENISRID